MCLRESVLVIAVCCFFSSGLAEADDKDVLKKYRQQYDMPLLDTCSHVHMPIWDTQWGVLKEDPEKLDQWKLHFEILRNAIYYRNEKAAACLLTHPDDYHKGRTFGTLKTFAEQELRVASAGETTAKDKQEQDTLQNIIAQLNAVIKKPSS